MKQTLKQLWKAVINTPEWEAFINHFNQLDKDLDYFYDFCDHSGMNDASLDKQASYLSGLQHCIDQISNEYIKKIKESN